MGVAEASVTLAERTPRKCNCSHDPLKTHASFDDRNLVSRAGLIPVMALAARCGLADLAGERVRIASRASVGRLKIPGLVAGMARRRGGQHR